MPPVSVSDHVRPVASDYPDGNHRVVGTSGATVTLLRVGDADGRRVNTGDVIGARDDEVAGFEPAENPSGDRSFGAAVASSL